MPRTPRTPYADDRPLTAPETLSHEAVAVFRELVAAVGPDHFRPVDRPLVGVYAEALCLARQARAQLGADGPVDADGKVSPWLRVYESAMKTITTLAARLRVCPQSRLDRTRAGVTTRAPADAESQYAHYFTGGDE
jgi:phage terminase small subunit